jgi:UDP-3-O-[3-hydroxymyristoyl] N-acetylglucosamine deacetylase
MSLDGVQASDRAGVAAAALVPGWRTTEGTLAHALSIDGRGLHTGRRVHVRILPTQSGGVVFRRMRGSEVLATLAVDPALRHAQPLCTMLRDAQGHSVRTTEHLLASLLACEIDHALIELDAEEVPILDGSATPWLEALRACGRVALPAPKRFIRVLKPVRVLGKNGGAPSEMLAEPADHYALTVRNALKGFGQMSWSGVLTPASFTEEIAPSRSYGRLKWAVPAILAGYARGMPILRGARRSSTAVIVGDRVLGGMRVPDELVRHRVLDLVGDLALAGAPLLGAITAYRPSHEMNFRLVDALLSTPGAWEWAS